MRYIFALVKKYYTINSIIVNDSIDTKVSRENIIYLYCKVTQQAQTWES